MFFANSGVAWPDFEKDTRDAGARALRTASDLFKMFADLESGEVTYVRERQTKSYAETLDSVAQSYEKLGSSLQHATLPQTGLTEKEFSEWFGPYPYVELWPQAWVVGGAIQIGVLFQELAIRARALAATIRELKPKVQAVELAPTVFRIMAQWESFERLARLVAAINRQRS